MTRTPWGDSEKLRSHKLAPGARRTREEVTRSQRERLFAAMVAICAEQGYEATTVAELVALSGVSRADFYKHFANKEECFCAALEEILGRSAKAVGARYDGRGSALGAFTQLIVEEPAAARLCFVESFAGGARAVAAMDRAVVGFEALMKRGLEELAGGTEMPTELVKAIVGGLRKVIYTRLRRGREAELGGLVDQLWEWSSGYRPPPQRLRRRRGGARPGARNELFDCGDAAQRLMAAATETIATRGYPATTIEEIAKRASVSFGTFYEHFDGKEDVFAAALETGQAQMLERALGAYQEADGWAAAVRAAFEAITDFLADQPSFAQLAIVEIFSGTMRALERRDRTVEGLQVFLAPGYERAPQTPEIAAEAIGGATYELVYRQVRSGGSESLPRAAPLMTYVALAPFIGAEEACGVANGGG